MENKNVLIIENNQTHFQDASKVFKKYGIGVYPSQDEFATFSGLLREFGRTKSDESLEKIKSEIDKFKNFDYVILDIDFAKEDRSGYVIQEKILSKFYETIDVCFLSHYPKPGNSDNYIEKEDKVSWEDNLYSKVISKLLKQPNETQLEQQKPQQVAQVIDEVKEKAEKKRIDKEKAETEERTSLPKGIKWLVDKERFKILPTVSFLVDSLIKYFFYITITLLFVYAPIHIICSIIENRDTPFQVAEHAFIVFLPFLIACGFYVFYIKSLSPYILQKDMDIDDFEPSSNLMKLTKKLFISSLLSYLFIKLIELLLLESGSNTPPPFSEKYKMDSPIALIYFVIGFILILLLYYIYIDRNHKPKKDEK